MATQAQRRAEARAAVNRFAQEFRATDSAGERLQREILRLRQRKTLIGVDDLKKLADLLATYVRLVDSLQRLYAILLQVLQGLPR